MLQNKRNRNLQKVLNIRDVGLVEVLSLTGFARAVGKSRDSILRYEKTDVLPMAPLKVKGCRYYPVSLAKRLLPLIKKFPPNKKPSAELIAGVNKIFNEEREKLCPR